MALEVTSSNIVCSKCGRSYGKRKGYFPVSYAVLHKGIGYIPVCRDCVEELYNKYLAMCETPKDAARQVCRKLDLYWNSSVYNSVELRNTKHTVMSAYIAKINTSSFVGKSYDDTLAAEGAMWSWRTRELPETKIEDSDDNSSAEDNEVEISEEVKLFWGPGFTPTMYQELEERKQYWMSRLPEDVDIGTEALIRQICNLEITINQDRAAGKPIDKNVNALNTLLGSASLKPAQKKQDEADSGLANTPLGVWLYRYENKRPLPEVDDDLKDVNKTLKYIHTWVMGHLAKMFGLKNYYSKLYEDEIARLTVEKPEYDGNDDEDLLNDIFSGGGNNE